MSILMVQKLFKWLMVVFVGELQSCAEFYIWDMFFIKGTIVIFWAALSVMKVLQEELLKPENSSFEAAYSIINSYCNENISRVVLLKNLDQNSVTAERVTEMREMHRDQVL